MIKMTEREYMQHLEDSTGVCTNCRSIRECCEPDARNYRCDECGEDSVFGVEELLMEGNLQLVEEK